METPNRADAFPLRDRLADPAPSPSQRAFTKEEAVHLRRAIGELDEELSSVLHLKYFEEMSCRDVAETLGIPEGTVWSRTYRALEQLRALIDPDLRAGGVPIR
jgi:RNA polymerase sigma-70 factor (ECF subfamily)